VTTWGIEDLLAQPWFVPNKNPLAGYVIHGGEEKKKLQKTMVGFEVVPHRLGWKKGEGLLDGP